ncbi:hypothetical protein THF1C08_50059 [Vibrio jasicida]|uniref:Uncharacterized protein n=1 Tax=Vibrio jasicida TaxID=766224 RepID=A0AAU9QXS0_9VIBR|nr:hypothetical protein THF1C08_50059 [Vibrio jasicida]CAH1601876.1 hypothetical protein THF1A12_50290 [Vibrio jasicida]
MKKLFLDYITEDEGRQLAPDDWITYIQNSIGESVRLMLSESGKATNYNEVRKVLESKGAFRQLCTQSFSSLPEKSQALVNRFVAYNDDYILLLCSGPFLYETIEVNDSDKYAVHCIGTGVESLQPGDPRIYETLLNFESVKAVPQRLEFEQYPNH